MAGTAPRDVVVEATSEFQINEVWDGIEIVKMGAHHILWRHVVPESQFLKAMERFVERRKRDSAKV